MQSKNLAARAGCWSAQHRKAAIGGWLAFVVLATIAGMLVGTRQLADEEQGNGSSRAADIATANAGFRDTAGEQVLIQSRRAGDPQLAAAARELTARLNAVPHVENVVSPYAPQASGQLSPDGRSALLTFDVAGDDSQAQERVDAALQATAAVQRAHPDLRIGEVGSASVDKAFEKAMGDDFQKAEKLSIPITLLILLVAFGALVAAGLPLLLGMTAVAAALALLGPLSQLVAVNEQIASVVLLIGLAVGVDYSMFYVRREMEERDAGKGPEAAIDAAAATSVRLRLRRDDLDGRDVPVGQLGLRLVRDRDDRGRRRRGRRLADVHARDARLARKQGLDREGPRAVRRQAAPPHRRPLARVELDPRPRPRAPADLGGRGDGAARRADDPCAGHAHPGAERRGSAPGHRGQADLRSRPAGVPGRAGARRGRRAGTRRHGTRRA